MLTPSDAASAVRSSSPDVYFRETMSGGFALGVDDPVRGALQGRRTRLTFHATILVDDLDAFLRDPTHAARLLARMSYPPLGEPLFVDAGTFNLFRPGKDARTRWMSYGMPFVHHGRDYYLAGDKELRDDPGPDLWHDTTRLACRLHAGSDASGPVVGAGVLGLGLGQVLRIIASLRSSRPDSASRFEARMRFGRFFLGALWDLYTPRAPEPTPPPSPH